MSSPGVAGRDGSVSRSEPSRTDLRFPRSCRLTSRQQFVAVYERGRRVPSPSFVLFGLPNASGRCRLGVTVTRKIGGAVRRNRVKRALREVFRLHWRDLEPPLDLVINARRAALEAEPATLEREFLAAFARLARKWKGQA